MAEVGECDHTSLLHVKHILDFLSDCLCSPCSIIIYHISYPLFLEMQLLCMNSLFRNLDMMQGKRELQDIFVNGHIPFEFIKPGVIWFPEHAAKYNRSLAKLLNIKF